MSPERAKVFISEDDSKWRKKAEEALFAGGHQVVLSAINLKDSLAAIERFAEFGVQVAIIDRNLDGTLEGDDGQAVLAAIRQKTPQVKTIGFSVLEVPGVDIDLGKHKDYDLGKTVTEI